MKLSYSSLVVAAAAGFSSTTICSAFQVLSPSTRSTLPLTSSKRLNNKAQTIMQIGHPLMSSPSKKMKCLLQAKTDDDDEEEEKVENPYADPNYPDLEFINYDDPEYEVDQGVTDEFFDTDEKVEEMREERRRRNDEYQFETYHAEMLKSGDLYKGEWTVYRTSTFLEGIDDNDHDNENTDVSDAPRFKKERRVRKVVTNGKKIAVDTVPEGGFEFRVDGERIIHEERVAVLTDFEDAGEEEWEEYNNINGKFDPSADGLVGKRYYPEEMKAKDFRGEGGIMCVGNCYTICDAVPLNGNVQDTTLATSSSDDEDDCEFDGPFSELRTEVGIQYKRMRFRVKWDYRVKEDDLTKENPVLYLYSMIVCRETRERWPRYQTVSNVDDSITEPLFGPPGAPGGLYDPPPVGSDQQAMQYMLLDLEGYASVLFPYKIDQDPEAHDGNGWVQSLDWSPGRIRFQADRKVLGGTKVRGLKTLELSEVEAKNADQWRPSDDGQDMRQ